MAHSSSFIYWFSEVDKDDVSLVGGKGANLGEMTKAGFPVPDGFVISSRAYFSFLRENNLTVRIKNLLKTVNFEHQLSLTQVSSHIQKEILRGELSDALTQEIFKNYQRLSEGKDTYLALRSSATAEDLPTASFAGQQETFLNIKGEAVLVAKVKDAWASLFTPRAIFYRHEKKFYHFKVGIALVVQQMIEAEQSGVMFTIDPVLNDKTKIVIEAIFGLGELIVQGKVTPDHYEVNKLDFTLFKKNLARQEIFLHRLGTKTREIELKKHDGEKQKISDHMIKELARIGKKLEHHYYFPQDIEWAIAKNKIYIIQTRAVTTITHHKKETAPQSLNLPVLLSGAPASPGVACGPAKVIHSPFEMNNISLGDILIAEMTNPDYVSAMKKAAAIVTDKGGRTSHAAIVSRELGKPAIVGTGNATQLIKEHMVITVNGTTGIVYKGGCVIRSEDVPINKSTSVLKTTTKLYLNLAQPDEAAKASLLPVDGIGLLRAEFIMATMKIHPKKAIREHKKHEYIAELAEKISIFCQAFSPRPVVYRLSDFKTNEYRDLIGGRTYEPVEPNPLLGFRGAFRYLHDPETLSLELEAIKKVRNTLGLKNLWVMIPYIRTIKELIGVKKLLTSAGLYRSPTFKIWMMVEIPANVLLLDKFIEVGIDGISIGSNDLTMLLLGTDRDNSDVAYAYDEQNEAVLMSLEKIIKTAQVHKITSSICGQAPSQFPDLIEKLVHFGISSISVPPDTVESVKNTVALAERKLETKKS